MAYRAVNRDPQDAAHSPKLRRIADRLIKGCLTVPFDGATLACVESGHPFLSCVEGLARRAPERQPSLRILVEDLRVLGTTLDRRTE